MSSLIEARVASFKEDFYFDPDFAEVKFARRVGFENLIEIFKS